MRHSVPTRERILEAASELFYRDGIGRSSVDGIVAVAGHTKPTLYNLFGSKEGLVEEVLKRRFEARRDAVRRLLAGIDDPMKELLAVLRSQEKATTMPGFRGCPLVNASLEAPESGAVRALARDYKLWLEGVLRSRATAAGLEKPARLARSLMLLLDGANVLAYVEENPRAGRDATAAARALIAQHTPTRRRPTPSGPR